MIARGFRPVGWVAALGAAALGCYMLSLRVASERADLDRLDRRIVAAQQSIRTLQTEVGTRSRIPQLEEWNNEVLALAAPAAGQFVAGNASLARFDIRQPQLAEPAEIRLASADVCRRRRPAGCARARARCFGRAGAAPRGRRARSDGAAVRRASLEIGADAPAPVRSAAPKERTRPAPAPTRTASSPERTRRPPRPSATPPRPRARAPPRRRTAPTRRRRAGPPGAQRRRRPAPARRAHDARARQHVARRTPAGNARLMATLAAHIDRPSTPAEQPQGLGLTYHRLMLVMLLFVGVTLVIVGRLAMLQVFTDRTGAARLADPLLPPRGDIVDRNGVALARTIDAWSIAARPRDIIGDRRELAQRLHALIPGRSAAQYHALLNDRRSFVYLARPASPELVTAVNAWASPASSSAASPSGSIRRPHWPATSSAGPIPAARGWAGWRRRSSAG